MGGSHSDPEDPQALPVEAAKAQNRWWNSDFNLFLLPGGGFPAELKDTAYD